MTQNFTYEYDATQGVLIAAALREKAQMERQEAHKYRNAAGPFAGTYAEQARVTDNRAQLLEDAADTIQGPVRAALAADMGKAIREADALD